MTATLIPDAATLESAFRAAFGETHADPALRALALARGSCVASGREAAFDRAASVAQLLLSQGADPETVGAALVSGALTPEEIDLAAIESAFGVELAGLLRGLSRAGRIEALSSNKSDPERVRKMLLAIAEDVRVVLIKLAEQVVFLRGLTKDDSAARQTAGEETLVFFAPLANRLGVSQLKWELEDLAFRFTEPDLYKTIAGQLDERRQDREAYIARVIETLRHELGGMGIDATIQGRPKHLYSILKKMRGKNLPFERLYDIRAVRVIVKGVRECYTVLGVVHDLWTPIEGEFDDYIASPKANDYRSLHTAVTGPEGRTLEVQIRTEDMHRQSELGVAAHWRYKEGRRADEKFDAKIAWLREVIAWRADVAGATRGGHGLFEDTIYVLTPQGKVVDLPAGSTPLDFAYAVHTDLGHRCRGAKVDGAMVPLTTRLQNAQRVEILAAKQGGPSRDWLSSGYLASGRALAKVRAWFRAEDFEQDVASGRAVLDKELARLGATAFAHERIADACGFPRVEELLAALGRGEVTQRQIEIAVRGEPLGPAQAAAASFVPTPAPAPRATSSGVMVLGVNNIATQMARCCKPVPPDPIVGFVTRTRGVMVHRADCVNVRGLQEGQQDRVMPADWGRAEGAGFSADIDVVASDRQGLLRDISEAIARERINVTAVNTLSRGAQAFMRFTLQVSDSDGIQRVLRQVREVPGVDSAHRR